MTPMLTARRGMAVIAMGALAVTGCGRSNTTTSEALTGSTLVSTTVPTTSPTTVPATSAPTTAPTTATPVTSTPSPTVPPTSTPATTPATTPTTTPTTTTVPPLTVADLTLASNGVLPITFGTAATSAVARLGQALGAPDVDEAHVYPNDTGHAYTDDLDEFEYGWPVGRTVCWQNLCVEFGGTTTDSLALTGWTYSAGSGPTITTANGVTAGSSVYDFRDAINVDAGGCYSVGYGDMDGIGLVLQSFGDPFSYTTDDGTWISQVPHPADIEVMSLEAGDRPIFLYGDC